MRLIGPGIGITLLLAGCAGQEPATQAAAPAPRPVAAPTAAPAPTGQHWLVGRWRGEVAGVRGDNRRSLVVTAVGADGTVTGRWGGQATPMTLSGDTLSLMSAGNIRYELRRTGPNELQGSTMQGSIVRSLTMTRE